MTRLLDALLRRLGAWLAPAIYAGLRRQGWLTPAEAQVLREENARLRGALLVRRRPFNPLPLAVGHD